MKRVLVIMVTICFFLMMSACGNEAQGTEKKEQATSAEEAGSATASQSEVENQGEASNTETSKSEADKSEARNADGSAAKKGTTESGATEEMAGGEASDGLQFETVDIDGNAVTNEIMEGAKLVLLNLWEPWCGPCVGEMPDLEKLYEEYKDQGLLILGVYATFSMDEDAKEIVTSLGITYPILKADSELLALEQSYVPATFLLDCEGRLLYEEPIAGARDYDTWKEIVLYFMSEQVE